MVTDLLSFRDSSLPSVDSVCSYKVLHKTASTVTLLIDQEFLAKRPELDSDPATWSLNLIKVIIPNSAPSFSLLCSTVSGNFKRPQVVAVRFDSTSIDIKSAVQHINLHLNEWVDQYMANQMSSQVYDIKFSKQLDVQKPRIESSVTGLAPKSSNHLNLYNLLIKLGDPSITTIEQRCAIKQVITEFLNNEITSSKLFVYLNHVLGYNVLESIINSLSQDDKITDAAINTTAKITTEEKKDLRQRTHIFRSVYANLKWIRLSKSLYCNTFGHKLCYYGSSCLIFGGLFLKNIILEKDIFPTFERVRQINTSYLSSKLIDTSVVHCPPSLACHSAVLTCHNSFLHTVVYGGFQQIPEDSMSIGLSTALYRLNLTTHAWSILDSKSEVRPAPRHSHASTCYPYCKLPYDSMEESEFLIIYGGLGLPVETIQQNIPLINKVELTQLRPLHDLWLFDFKNSQWVQIKLNLYPSARFGLDFLYVSSNILVLYGGETVACDEFLVSDEESKSKSNSKYLALGLPIGKRILLGDTWLLILNKIKSSNELFSVSWQLLTEDGPPRAHYATVALTTPIEYNYKLQMEKAVAAPYITNQTSVHGNSALNKTNENYYRVIFYISGLAQNADGIISETPSIMIGLFYVQDNSKVSVQYRTVTLDDTSLEGGGFQGRRGHSAVFFQAPAETPEKLVMRAMISKQKFVLNEDKTNNNENISTEESASAKSVDSDSNMNTNLKTQNSHTKEESTTNCSVKTESVSHNLKNEAIPEEIEFGTTHKKSQIHTNVPCILVCGGVWGDNFPLNDVQILCLSSIYPQFNMDKASQTYCINLKEVSESFSANEYLINTCKYDFDDTAATLSLENSEIIRKFFVFTSQKNIYPPLYQTGLSIPAGLVWSLSTLVKHPFTAIAHFVDNAMDNLVKAKNISVSFETWLNTEIIQIMNDQLGLSYQNFHILLKRFGIASEHLRKTKSSRYGLGFKLGVGRLARNALVLTKSTTLFGVGLFSTNLNSLFGTNTFACPITCWSVNNNAPIIDAAEEAGFAQSLQLILSHSPLKNKSILKKEFQKFGNSTGTRIILFDLKKDSPCLTIDKNSNLSSYSHSSMIPSVSSTCNLPKIDATELSIEPLYDGIQLQVISPIKLPSTFPLYTDALSAIDYNAATYLFWCFLHCSANLYLNGVILTPSSLFTDREVLESNNKDSTMSSSSLTNKNEFADARLLSKDDYSNSLWRFLQNNLHNKMEFPYLIYPQYGDQNFYGIIGFLNDRTKEKPTVCETGVLLYHKGRFINRCILSFPLLPEFIYVEDKFEKINPDSFTLASCQITAVINMPNFYNPRADKEGFMLDSDPSVQNVYDRLEKAIKEYLSVCEDATELKKLQTRYINEFDAFRESQWNERKYSYGPNVNDISPKYQLNDPEDINLDSNNLQEQTQQSENEFTNNKTKRRRKTREDDGRNLRRRRRTRYRSRKEDDEENLSNKQTQSDDGVETQ